MSTRIVSGGLATAIVVAGSMASAPEADAAEAKVATKLNTSHTQALQGAARKLVIGKRSVPDDPDPWDENWNGKKARDRVNPATLKNATSAIRKYLGR